MVAMWATCRRVAALLVGVTKHESGAHATEPILIESDDDDVEVEVEVVERPASSGPTKRCHEELDDELELVGSSGD